jgi:omega-6 fatty acid desaturase (delta-12 desaturase)
MTASLRSGSELIKATRVYGQEDAPTTWRLFGVTALVSVGAFLAALLPLGTVHPWLEPLRWLASAVLGLTIVRVFIFFHDAMHGAIFRKSKLGDVFMWIHGALVLTPSRVWKDSHNYHHAHTSKLVGSQIGSFPILTKRMYLAATPTQRFLYRFTRHWATICLGYVFMFLIGMCLQPMFKQPKRYAVEVLIACALGSYLFYAQHNFPKVRLTRVTSGTSRRPRSTRQQHGRHGPGSCTGSPATSATTTCTTSTRRSRSTASPRRWRAMPELQQPNTTTLWPHEIWKCLRLRLWERHPVSHSPFPVSSVRRSVVRGRLTGQRRNDRTTERRNDGTVRR